MKASPERFTISNRPIHVEHSDAFRFPNRSGFFHRGYHRLDGFVRCLGVSNGIAPEIRTDFLEIRIG